MNYLIFPDQASADARNHAMAVAQGAGGANDVTQFWWAVQDHPTNGERALLIPDADLASLSSGEQAAVVTSLSTDWTPSAPSRS